MKKIYLIIIGLVGLLAVSVSFAAEVKANYYSTNHPRTLLTANSIPVTDITILNYSSDVIYVNVEGANFRDRLLPNGVDHIYNDDYGIYKTTLHLSDSYGEEFTPWSGLTVCRHAVITVYGYQGSYSWDINDVC